MPKFSPNNCLQSIVNASLTGSLGVGGASSGGNWLNAAFILPLLATRFFPFCSTNLLNSSPTFCFPSSENCDNAWADLIECFNFKNVVGYFVGIVGTTVFHVLPCSVNKSFS